MSESKNPFSWKNLFQTVFSLDSRSLALFRILIGGTIIADLILRWPTLKMMCSDEGAYTRETGGFYWNQIFGQSGIWPLISVHHFSGEYNFQVALFVVAFLAALCLMTGFWTRIATIASWFLLASLQARNPFILSSGDMIMRMLMLWMVYLPAGRFWSIDSWLKRRKNKVDANDIKTSVCSVASAGFIIQFAAMYFFTGIGKYNEVWWSGQAMQYVLRLDIYVQPYGRSLLEYPALMELITHATLWGEIILPLLLFVPWKNSLFRYLNIAVYLVLHLSIAGTMVIGLFPFICIVCWLALLPPITWNWKSKSDGSVDEAHTLSILEQKTPLWKTGISYFGSAIGIATIVFFLTWNINNHLKNEGKKSILSAQAIGTGHFLMVDQYFLMFYRPPNFSPWFVYEATLENGKTIDLLTGEPPTEKKPDNIAALLRYHHIRKLHRNVVVLPPGENVDSIQKRIRLGLANYYVNQWQQTHEGPEKITAFRLICYKEHIGPGSTGTDLTTEIWHEFGADGSLFEKEFNKMMNDFEGF